MSSIFDLPRSQPNQHLVVSLTVLPDDALGNIKDLMKDHAGNEIENFTFVSCPRSARQQELEKLGQDGCVAEIYTLAIKARALSWDQIIIIDALTREQLSGEVRRGHSLDVSVILVQIDDLHENYRHSLPAGDGRIGAKRMSIREAIMAVRKLLTVSYRLPDDDGELGLITRGYSPQAHFDSGVLLYDPEKQLYDKSVVSSASEDAQLHQILAMKPTLPAELVNKITDYARSDVELEELTAAPVTFDADIEGTVFDIHALVPLEAGQLREIQDRFNQIIREYKPNGIGDPEIHDHQCIIHAWKGHKPATRSETWRLYQRVYERNSQPHHTYFLFIGWHGWDAASNEVGLIRWFDHELPPTNRYTITSAAISWRMRDTTPGGGSEMECRIYSDPEFELFVNPRARFFHDLPKFVRLDGTGTPVFYLTRHLSPNERNLIEEELMTAAEGLNGEQNKDYHYVEWDQEEDGGEADIWRLISQISSYRGRGNAYSALFIDKQSPTDKKVILAKAKLHDDEGEAARELIAGYIYGECTGVLWGRCEGRRAFNGWCELDISFVEEEQVADATGGDVHTYERPGEVWKEEVPNGRIVYRWTEG